MRTVQEIEASLPNLSTDELQHIERVIRELYRSRNEIIIYDDSYGIWTEQDQASAAAEVFQQFEEEEDLEDGVDA